MRGERVRGGRIEQRGRGNVEGIVKRNEKKEKEREFRPKEQQKKREKAREEKK